jgi:NAD(P)-dependent dehydrogenase (short-subunit alcohol dehydrogenase family)
LAQPIGEMTPEALTKSYEVNLHGPVFLVQKALPHLKRSEHAAVLNMVSVGAFNFAPALGIYASVKAALMSFTRSMAAGDRQRWHPGQRHRPGTGQHRHDAQEPTAGDRAHDRRNADETPRRGR